MSHSKTPVWFREILYFQSGCSLMFPFSLIFPKHSQEDIPWTYGPDGRSAFSWWSRSFTLSSLWCPSSSLSSLTRAQTPRRKLRPVSCSDLGSYSRLSSKANGECSSSLLLHLSLHSKSNSKDFDQKLFFSISEFFFYILKTAQWFFWKL